ncbi:MAG: hypothetical protein ACRDRL_13120, partial [Sciscionella sp.]
MPLGQGESEFPPGPGLVIDRVDDVQPGSNNPLKYGVGWYSDVEGNIERCDVTIIGTQLQAGTARPWSDSEPGESGRITIS